MSTPLVPLNRCVQISPGFSTKKAVVGASNGTHQVVMGRHVVEGEPYRYRDEDVLRISPDRPVDKYLLQPGDILFVCRGVRNYPILIENVPKPSIATSTFFIIRAGRDVDPGYLVWCLQQARTEACITELRTGAGTPMIPRAGFGEISIPLPDMNLQKDIARLWRLQGRESALRQQLAKATEQLNRLVGQQVFNRILNDNSEEA